MEAMSVEDQGEDVCFNVYVYNVQPGVTIDYATGDSWVDGEAPTETPAEEEPPVETETPADSETPAETTYILNTNSRKFHLPDCSSAGSISPANREEYTGSREDLIAQGYSPCGQCKP